MGEIRSLLTLSNKNFMRSVAETLLRWTDLNCKLSASYLSLLKAEGKTSTLSFFTNFESVECNVMYACIMRQFSLVELMLITNRILPTCHYSLDM
jgi:hypothetical protein